MHTLLGAEKIQQLLGRRPQLNVLDVRPFVEGKSVLVTGAGGSIGSELCMRLIEMQPKSLVLYEMSEFALYLIEHRLREQKTTCQIIPILGNLASPDKLRKMIQMLGVETIYHAAAYKHVPLVERNPIVGIENNVLTARALVEAARSCQVETMVLVSTDKAVNPTNVMGASKRLAEYVVLSGRCPYKVVRFGNVLWSNGSVLPLFYRQLEEDRKLTVTHKDVTRYFMSIEEAVDLILQATALSHAVCVLDMGESIRIEDIALRLAKLMGKASVGIEYIGLRPGEKLHEELTLGEKLQETCHPYIKSADEHVPSYEDVSVWLRNLSGMCGDGDVGGIRTFLQKIVPGYSPSCGIVDEVWLQENVVKAEQALYDCYSPADPEK